MLQPRGAPFFRKKKPIYNPLQQTRELTRPIYPLIRLKKTGSNPLNPTPKPSTNLLKLDPNSGQIPPPQNNPKQI
jgi:hypothetical protein